MSEEIIGTVSDFFAHPVVGGIELTGVLKIGDEIRIKGHTADLEVTVDSMQIDNAAVTEVKAGDSIGVKVSEHADLAAFTFVILMAYLLNESIQKGPLAL